MGQLNDSAESIVFRQGSAEDSVWGAIHFPIGCNTGRLAPGALFFLSESKFKFNNRAAKNSNQPVSNAD